METLRSLETDLNKLQQDLAAFHRSFDLVLERYITAAKTLAQQPHDDNQTRVAFDANRPGALNRKEAAKFLSISITTLWKLEKTGAIRKTRYNRYPLAELERHLKESISNDSR